MNNSNNNTFNHKDDINSNLTNNKIVQNNISNNGGSIGNDNIELISTKPNTMENINITDRINDEELLKAFIGNNYDKIIYKQFNFSGFFFSFCYMFYRKMFLYGLLAFLINLIILNVIKNSIISLAFNVAIGFLVNKIYLFYANKKITKIKIQNPQMDTNELKMICSSKGGTSILCLIGGVITEIIISIFILIVMLTMGLGSLFLNVFTQDNKIDIKKTETISKEKDKSNTGDESYNEFEAKNGLILYAADINIQDEFTITVPSIFEKNNNYHRYDYYYSSRSDKFDKCSFRLSKINGYQQGDKLIKAMANSKYFKDDIFTGLASKKINNIEWTYFSTNKYITTTYYYGTTKNNYVYLFEYNIEQYADADCKVYKDRILNSITSK